MPDMPGMVRRLGRESTARRLGFARLGRLESWMLESGMHNSDRHHSTFNNAIIFRTQNPSWLVSHHLPFAG